MCFRCVPAQQQMGDHRLLEDDLIRDILLASYSANTACIDAIMDEKDSTQKQTKDTANEITLTLTLIELLEARLKQRKVDLQKQKAKYELLNKQYHNKRIISSFVRDITPATMTMEDIRLIVRFDKHKGVDIPDEYDSMAI